MLNTTSASSQCNHILLSGYAKVDMFMVNHRCRKTQCFTTSHQTIFAPSAPCRENNRTCMTIVASFIKSRFVSISILLYKDPQEVDPICSSGRIVVWQESKGSAQKKNFSQTVAAQDPTMSLIFLNVIPAANASLDEDMTKITSRDGQDYSWYCCC